MLVRQAWSFKVQAVLNAHSVQCTMNIHSSVLTAHKGSIKMKSVNLSASLVRQLLASKVLLPPVGRVRPTNAKSGARLASSMMSKSVSVDLVVMVSIKPKKARSTAHHVVQVLPLARQKPSLLLNAAQSANLDCNFLLSETANHAQLVSTETVACPLVNNVRLVLPQLQSDHRFVLNVTWRSANLVTT